MGGRGSSSMSGRKSGGAGTVYEQAAAYAAASYDETHPNGESISDRIPDWVLDKKLDGSERYAFDIGDGVFVKRETEKALLIANNTDYGQISFWMPKTWLKTAKQVRADSIDFNTRWIVGANYNTYLKQVASDSGVKLGAVKRTAKIQEKLAKKGVKYLSKEAFSSSSDFTVQNSSIYG